MVDYNPFLEPWRAAKPDPEAGKGSVELPHEVTNLIWQTRDAEPSPYENALGDALTAAFDAGIEEIGPLIDHLNRSGIHAPDGDPWTEEAFRTEMARLGF